MTYPIEKEIQDENEEKEIAQTYKFLIKILKRLCMMTTQCLIKSQGEISAQLILYLHCLFEINFVCKLVFNLEKSQNELPKLKTDRIALFEENINKEIESIMMKFDERLEGFDIVATNFQRLDLIYDTRIYLLHIIGRKYESFFYLLSKAKLYSLLSDDSRKTLSLFEICSENKEFIPNYEIEKAYDYIRRSSSLKAAVLLIDSFDDISDRVKNIMKTQEYQYKQIKDPDIPRKVKQLTLEAKTKK